MPAALLFVIFVVLLVIAIPVSITLGIASVLPSVFDPSFTVGAKYLIRAMFGGLDSFPLLAVPMFVLSGIIMAKGGISKKLFDIFAFFLGNFTAGMPCAVIVTCLFYGAISGSAPATVAAVGSMTIPILSALGYDRTFSTAIVAVAGGLGPRSHSTSRPLPCGLPPRGRRGTRCSGSRQGSAARSSCRGLQRP